jgi:predicted dehydrogenase
MCGDAMTPIRVGVLSFAHYHANFWCKAIRDDPRAELAGIWDDDHARGIDAAERFGTTFEPSLDALLAWVDAVAITSETAHHRPLIEAACARKLAVLCEKPLATTMEDALAIEHVVATSGVIFVQSFPKRLDPASHELRGLIKSGALGKIWLTRIRHGHNHGSDPAFTQGWWTDPVLSGGGTLIDEGVHATDFLLWLFGRPRSVQAMTAKVDPEACVEDVATAIFQWVDGMIAEITTGWRFQAAADSVEVYGTAATALLSGVDLASKSLAATGPYLRWARAEASSWTHVDVTPAFVTGAFHQHSVVAFIDTLVAGSDPPAGVREGREALNLVIAAYTAANEHAQVLV